MNKYILKYIYIYICIDVYYLRPISIIKDKQNIRGI